MSRNGLLRVFVALAVGALLPVASGAWRGGGEITPPPWERTESRADCTDCDGLRRPFFGEAHAHTGLSHDAYGFGTRSGPREAYDSAKGVTVSIPDENGGQTQMATIDRPLDWLMSVDHSGFFGEPREPNNQLSIIA